MFAFLCSKLCLDRIRRNPHQWLSEAFAAGAQAKSSGDYHTANVIWAVIWHFWATLEAIPRGLLRIEIEVDSLEGIETEHDLAVLEFEQRRISLPLPFLRAAAKGEVRNPGRSFRSVDEKRLFQSAPRVSRPQGGRRLSGESEWIPGLLDVLGIDHKTADLAMNGALHRRLVELDKVERRWPEIKPAAEESS